MEMRTGFQQTEVGVIPDGWESTTIRSLAATVRNAIVGGPFGSDLVSKDYVEQGVPVIRGQNMGSKYVSGSFVFVSPTKASSLEANLAYPGDLLFTQRGTLGQVSLVPDEPFDRYLVSQSQMKLTVNCKTADPLFYLYVFGSSAQQEFIRQSTIQTGVPHINLGILRSIPIQRPPLVEQKAIAKVLSDADAFIESLGQLLAKKLDLKQAAMQELLTGRTRLPAFETKSSYKQTDIGIIPEDWNAIALNALGTLKNGINKSSDAFGHGSPFVNLMDVFGVSSVASSASLGLVDTSIAEQQVFDLRKGDVIFIRSSVKPSGVGLTAVVEKDLPRTVYSGFLIRFRDRGGLDISFKRHCFYEEGFRKRVIGASSVSANTNINQNNLRQILLPLPPTRAEQIAIGTILSDMDAEIIVLEARLAKALRLKQGMMDELLAGRIRIV
jgi:type I restriction enzyme S subunit